MSHAKRLLSRFGLLDPARRARIALRGALARALHPAREALVRLPYPSYLLARRPPLDAAYRAHLSELRRDGITRIRGAIRPDTLAELQSAFDRFVSALQAGGRSAQGYQGDVTVTEEYHDPQAGLYSSNEPFTFCRALLEVCLDPATTGLINEYLGKRAYITQGVAYRIEPHANTGFGSFQWHHDAWGKRINLMIVLTEVGEGDQHMTYAKGSHLLHHSYDKYFDSRFTSEEFAAHCGHLPILNCYAQAGDVYVFDSNGIHSGNRTLGRTRDVFVIEYTRQAQTVWAHRIPDEYLRGFDEQRLGPLQWILRQDRTKRPLAPPVNSWVGQLPYVHQWLR
jgi:hypothetical protein